jgi:uncharacterized RDD family membrane protein YckC
LVLDLFAFGFLTFVVNSVFGVTQVTSTDLNGTGTMTATTTAVAWPWLTLLGVLYFAIPEAMFGASVGKQIMGLKVVRADGRPLALRDVVIRNVLKPVDFLPVLYLLGGVLVLATGAAQRVGDLAAGTTVVQAQRAIEPGATRTSGRNAKLALAAVLVLAAFLTAGFDYFGRPALIIAGQVNAGDEPFTDAASYRLGTPRWGFGTVSYPVTYSTAGSGRRCGGDVTFVWSGLAWNESGAPFRCQLG